MSRKTIHSVVREDGSITTDFINFSGTDCLSAGKQMHALLVQFGVQVDQTTFFPKPELLAAQHVQQDLMIDDETNQQTHAEG